MSEAAVGPRLTVVDYPVRDLVSVLRPFDKRADFPSVTLAAENGRPPAPSTTTRVIIEPTVNRRVLLSWLAANRITPVRVMLRLEYIDYGMRIERRLDGVVIEFADDSQAALCRLRWG